MSIKNSAIIRFSSYILGLIIQISTVFLLTTKLEIYQFGVWGVAMSFVFVLSTIFQMSYFQNIEKYFPNYDEKNKKIYFMKYLKTIVSFSPIVLSILLIINELGYFSKFNANNIFYLLIMIAILSVVESCLLISDSYYLAKNRSSFYDLCELLSYKLPRFITFIYLLSNGFSVYYLIFLTIVLRVLFMIILISYEYKNLYELFNFFKNNSIFENNFQNFKYNSIAFTHNSIYVSFINILFLISTNFLENIDIAHYSLTVIILNNLRPVMNSIPSVLSPLISNSIKYKFNINELLKKVSVLNQILISFMLLASIFIIENNAILPRFLSFYFDGIYKLIFLSIFASTLNSIYFSKYIELLFNKNEGKILLFNIFNSFFVLLAFLLIFINFYLINFIYIYIAYEFFFFLFIIYLSSGKKTIVPKINQFSALYISTLIISMTYIFDYYNFYYLLCVPIGIFIDLKFHKLFK